MRTEPGEEEKQRQGSLRASLAPAFTAPVWPSLPVPGCGAETQSTLSFLLVPLAHSALRGSWLLASLAPPEHIQPWAIPPHPTALPQANPAPRLLGFGPFKAHSWATESKAHGQYC